MIKLLEYIVKGITNDDHVDIEESTDGDRIDLNIHSGKESIGLIIGKSGRTIHAIRNILRVRSTLEKKYVNVSVEEKTS